MANLQDVSVGAVNKDDPQKQIESLIKQVNDQNRIISNEDRTKITKDDSGTPRLLQGYQDGGFSNGNVGAKLSQEGVDVLTATDDQLIWSTDFNTFKIVQTGTLTATLGIGQTQNDTTITHNLGYAPTFSAYLDYTGSGSGFQVPQIFFGVATSGTLQYYGIATDTSFTIRITVTTAGVAYNTPVKYYLFRETAV